MSNAMYPPGMTPEDMDKLAEEREEFAAAPEKRRKELEAQGIVATDEEMAALAIKMGMPMPGKRFSWER